MKIFNTPPVAKLDTYKVQRTKVNTAEAAQAGQRDEITFSSDATLFADTLKNAKSSLTDRINNSNVDLNAIKSQIESGSYEVDTEELANSMMMLAGYHDER